ncbi:two-component system chemotaxis response regulator CheV [Salsuginibacillus halophilus]|uniref:Two-component system chemotaxis response regulator CheV n=1 Tax=Salsuginibacillus halophilus TaxID=517424 RepID=A0A2P8HYP1_9BACI|nr:chemotaxis protein [Salsuginibacillus halophilus]PSL51352.1 two-component system chemotaxis response regulator CheV [Salsuginibacillus halophilus]
MRSEKNGDILLESGTNELEIVMFTVGTGTFGINVLKVREIIQPVDVTESPNRHPHVRGMIRLREEVLPVVDLAAVLGFEPQEQTSSDKFIIAELNQTKVAFHVQSVSRIHRISWGQIEKPNEISQGMQSHTIGVVKMEDSMALLLDYEKIIADIAPEAGFSENEKKRLNNNTARSEKSILIAEDSSMLRHLLDETLTESGYTNIMFMNDGEAAWDYIISMLHSTSDIRHKLDLIITDIEMPRMDGHHLTHKVKEHKELQHLPVVIFSSLITDDLMHKGYSVGANDQVSKPDIARLVETLDHLLLETEQEV